MNKLYLFLICMYIGNEAFTQNLDKKAVALDVKEAEYNFGKILQGRPVTHVFTLINNGTEPIKLDEVQATCGCTTPVWKKEPIAPGATSNITVGFNAAADGAFQKSISILYNSGQLKTLVIKGNVLKAPLTSAPVNKSIQLLKQ